MVTPRKVYLDLLLNLAFPLDYSEPTFPHWLSSVLRKVLHTLLHRCPSVLPEDMSEKMRVVEPLYSRKGICEVLGSRGELL